jgi:hypothetical protein
MYVMDDSLTREQPGRPKRFAVGTLDNQRAHTLGPITAGGSVKLDVSGSELLDLNEMTFGAATRSGAGPYQHAFKPGNATPSSATIERHDGAQIMRGTGYMVDTLTIAGSASGENTATYALFGSTYGPWGGPLTSLSQRTPTFLEGWQTRMWLSAFGTSSPPQNWIRDALIAWSVSIKNNLGRKYFARNSQDTAGLTTGELEITANLTLEGVSATAAAEFNNWVGQTFRQVRLEFVGPNGALTAGTAEVQTLTSTATGGTFLLTVFGLTTGTIAFNASAATIQTALDTLLGTGQVTVAGGPLNTTPVTLTFGGQLAQWNVPQVTADNTAATGGTVVPSTTTPGVSGAEYVTLDLPLAWSAMNLTGDNDGTRTYELQGNYVYDSALAAGIVLTCQTSRATTF